MSHLNTNQAVKMLFGINASYLRTKANSFVRNKTIPDKFIIKEGFSDSSMGIRGKVHLERGALVILYNAFMIDAFINDPKVVKEAIHEPSQRASVTLLIEETLLSLGENSQRHPLSPEVSRFVNQLKDPTFNLIEKKLEMPFKDKQLPQLSVSLTNTGLLREVLLKNRLALNASEQLILAILNNELESAYKIIQTLEPDILNQDTTLQMLASFVQQQYREAVSFTHFLSLLPE